MNASSSAIGPPITGGNRRKRANKKPSGNKKDGNDRGKGKDGKNPKNDGKGKLTGWINNQLTYQGLNDGDKLKNAELVYEWYHSFLEAFNMDVVKRLKAGMVKHQVAWEVQEVMARLEQVCELVEKKYYPEASDQVGQLRGIVPKRVLTDDVTGVVVQYSGSHEVEQMFRNRTLMYAKKNLAMVLQGFAKELHNKATLKLRSFAGFESAKLARSFVSLHYDPLFDLFYAHYAVENDTTPIISVIFEIGDKSNLKDEKIRVEEYSKVSPHIGPSVVQIVAVDYDPNKNLDYLLYPHDGVQVIAKRPTHRLTTLGGTKRKTTKSRIPPKK